jgi:hypothetical protein
MATADRRDLSYRKLNPHELMVKKPPQGTGTYFVFGRDNHRCMSVQDTAASGGISGRLSITLSTKPKSLAVSAVIK